MNRSCASTLIGISGVLRPTVTLSLPNGQWTRSGSRVLLLLALSVFINYLDRRNLSIAAPLLKSEFQLSATQLGVLLPSFLWTYSFFLPLSGWLVDCLDVKWVLRRFTGDPPC